MATTIHNVISVILQGVNSATAAADRTFTTTRALRVFDMKSWSDTTAAGIGTPQVSNAGNLIMRTTCPGAGTVANTVYRAGGDVGGQLVTICDDAQMLVAAGGTLVFDSVQAGSDWDFIAFCITE